MIGVIYLLGARASEAGAKAVVVTLSTAYLALGNAGLFLTGTSANVVALNGADNLLHVVTGLSGLLTVTVGRKQVATA